MSEKFLLSLWPRSPRVISIAKKRQWNKRQQHRRFVSSCSTALGSQKISSYDPLSGASSSRSSISLYRLSSSHLSRMHVAGSSQRSRERRCRWCWTQINRDTNICSAAWTNSSQFTFNRIQQQIILERLLDESQMPKYLLLEEQ